MTIDPQIMAWATAHWWMAFWLAIWGFCACALIAMILLEAFSKLISRILRLIMVMARGWPPPHLDADGDANENWESPEGGSIGDMCFWRGGHVHGGVVPSTYTFVGDADATNYGLPPGLVHLYRSEPL